VLLALTAMTLIVFIMISLRFLNNVNAALMVFVTSVAASIMGLTISFATVGVQLPEKSIDIWAILALNILVVVGQFGVVWALKYEEASLVSAIRCSEVVFGFMWQMIIGVFPDAYRLASQMHRIFRGCILNIVFIDSYGGASLVLFCIGIILIRKYLKHLPKEHRWRKMLWMILT
jgi:drug/metabolite transporter (DMT)-like permease